MGEAVAIELESQALVPEVVSKVESGNKPDVGELLDVFNRMEETTNTILTEIPKMDDDKVLQTAIYAKELEGQAFRIRGCCASEMRGRIAKKLVGGRGKKDDDGVGIKSMLRRMAEECGIDIRTLEEDAKIYDEFFAPNSEETSEVNNTRLSREYYRVALQAPDPHVALAVAEEKTNHDAGFNTRKFNQFVKELKKSSVTNIQEAQKIVEENYWLNVPITQEARLRMVELCQIDERQPGLVVTEAILMLYDYVMGNWKTP